MRPQSWFGPAVFVAAAVSAFAALATLLRQPLDHLVTFIADDAFYYLQIARNIADLGRVTFDGQNTATGFHPLWLVMLTGLARVTPDRLAFLQRALALGLIFHVATSFVVVLIVREWRRGLWPWLAGAIWVVQRQGWMYAVDGMETSVSLFMIALGTWGVLRLCRPVESTRSAIAIGGVVGAAAVAVYITRTDGLSFAAVGMCIAAGLAWSARDRLASLRAAAATITVTAGAMAALSAGLWITTGRATQASGEMKLLWGARGFSLLERVQSTAIMMSNTWFGVVPRRLFGVPQRLSIVMVVAAFATLAILSLRDLKRGDVRLGVLGLWLVGSTSINGLLYGLLFPDVPDWYTGQATFAIVCACLVIAARMPALSAGVKRAGVAIALVFIAWSAQRTHHVAQTGEGRYWFMTAIYHLVEPIDRLVPPGDAVAAFDAGTLAYFGHRRVVNLDGLVNDAVLPYWRAQRVDVYLAAQGFRYITDDPAATPRVQGFGAHWPALTPIACVPNPLPPGFSGRPFPDRCLFRIDRTDH